MFERAAWSALFAITVVAAVFATKSSETPRATGGAEARLSIESQPNAHFHQPTTIRVQVRAVDRDGFVRVWVPADYLQKVEVQDISPKPVVIDAEPDRLVYVFRRPDAGSPVTFSFTFLPTEVGPLAGRMGLSSGEEQTFSQFVYP